MIKNSSVFCLKILTGGNLPQFHADFNPVIKKKHSFLRFFREIRKFSCPIPGFPQSVYRPEMEWSTRIFKSAGRNLLESDRIYAISRVCHFMDAYFSVISSAMS